MAGIAFFSARPYERTFFDRENSGHSLNYLDAPLDEKTARLAAGSSVVCAFVNDHLDRLTMQILKENGIGLIALRCAGFNNVDLKAAAELGLPVVRVPAYSPYAVAEHTLALLLTLCRKTHRAFNRVREGNFSLDGLMGFDIHGKTVGVLGTGKIGAIFSRIMLGMGCRVLAYDLRPDTALEQAGVLYVDIDRLFAESDIISLHTPLLPQTQHIINATTLAKMKKGVIILNTSRGALLDTKAVVRALKSEHIGGLAIDVYEQEEGLFFQDLSGKILQDDTIARLLTFPNVLVTAHQAFFTDTAMQQIAQTTLRNIDDWQAGKPLINLVPG